MRSLPRVVSQIPNDLRNFIDRVREYLGEGGDSRFVTLKELKSGGIVGTTPGGTIIPPGEVGVQDPVVPTNLIATGGFATVFLSWDTPNYLGHAQTEIWAADTDDFTAKELIGATEANSYVHNIGTGATKYYWIRFINTLGTIGPYNATAGTAGTTSQDPDYLIQVLSDAYGVTGPAPFFQVDTPTVINGVTVPAGTYIKQAWIADATISRAKIQSLAVDDARIADLNVNKLTAGTMQVGSYIQSQSYVAGTSGWKINSDGSAEFANGTFRGSIYGSGATSFASGTGLFSGIDTLVVSSLTRTSTTATVTTSTAHGLSIGNTFTISGVTNDTGWNASYTVATVPSTTQITFTVSNTRTTPATGTIILTSAYRFRVGNPAGNRFTWDGSTLGVVGAITGSSISGSTLTINTAAVSGTTMTGSGAVFNSGGTFAIGNSTTNISFNGTTLTFNGNVVKTANIDTVNGITNTQFAVNSSGAIDFSTLSELTVATTPSIAIPADASAVLLMYSLAIYSDTSNSFSMTVRVYRNTTLLKATTVRLKASIDQIVSNIHVDDAPAQGTVTYKVTAQIVAGGTPGATNLQILTDQGTLVATLLKR